MNSSSFYIYNASAGSGKTYSLVKAYLKLLIQSPKADFFKHILAITFTNKAVAEMKVRIIETLKEFSDSTMCHGNGSMFEEIRKDLNLPSKTLQKKSQKILFNILKNYGAFDISTIDKFTQKLIRTFAFDLKLPLNFEVELDTESLLFKSVDNLISKAGTDNELTKLLIDFAIEKIEDNRSWDVSYDFNNISKLLVNENDIPFLNVLKNKTLDDFKALKNSLNKRSSFIEKQIKETALSALSLITNNGLEYSNFSRQTLPKHFIKASQLDINNLYSNKLQENLEQQSSIYNKTLDERLKKLIDLILPKLKTQYLILKTLIYQYKFISNCYKNCTPLSVLNLINKELLSIKIDENKLLISEFNSIVSDQIKSQPVPFIYERIGEKFKHYFIDEFQDTSEMQWTNLIPLIDNALSSENASLMIVGDAKQAIYRWRGGKANQFINLFNNSDNPFNIDSEIKSLDTNYRSSKAIIEFNNSFFRFCSNHAFLDNSHKELYHNSEQKTNSKKQGFVNLSFLNVSDFAINDLYPQKVLDQIHNCINLGYKLSDICVLVRKSKEGVAIANFLSDRDINIISSETLAVERSLEVCFIVSTLRYLMNHYDDQSKLEMLIYLVDKLEVPNKHDFISHHIRLNQDGFFKALSCYNILFDAHESVQLPIYELIESIIYQFSLTTSSDAYIQFFLNFTFKFSSSHSSNITDFLQYYDRKKDRLKINSPEGINAIQIMTIHKSKGLEFPIVIFPYADLNIYEEIDPKIWFSLDDDDYCGFSHTLLSYNKDMAEFGEQGLEIDYIHKTELELDSLNLLYVALTRAVEKLYIVSGVHYDSKKNIAIKNNRFSGLFMNYLKDLNLWRDEQLDYSFGKNDNVIPKKDSEKNTYHQQLFISIPRKEHQINILTKSGLLWDTSQKKAIEKGNLIHDVMSHIKTQKDISFALSSMLDTGIINNNQKNKLSKVVMSIVTHPKLKSYYSEKNTVFNERDIITSTGLNLRPDRLVFTNKQEVTIIDYKSGVQQKQHEAQLQTYQNALEDMGFNVYNKLLVYINDTIEIKEV